MLKRDSIKKAKFGIIKIILLVVFILVLLIAGFIAGIFFMDNNSKKTSSTTSSNGGGTVLQNPLSGIVAANTVNGKVDDQKVVEEGIKEFNEEYIRYLMIALGVGDLHKSTVFGNPKIEMNIDSDIWSAELIDGSLRITHAPLDQKDLIIRLSKEEAVRAILSSDIKAYMKNSVAVSGKTQIDMVAGKTELFSKGYLDMYNKLNS